MNPKNIFKTVPVPASDVRNARHFLVIAEYVAGVCLPATIAGSQEEAVEAFMVQPAGCAEGEISVFDRDEQRVVAPVKWKMRATEIGLRVPPRENVFHDWYLGLVALEVEPPRDRNARRN